MHKAILGGIAALVLSATAVSAGTIVTLDGYCNAYNIRKSGDGYVAKDTGCSNGFGAGDLVSVRGAGKTVMIGLIDPANTTPQQFVFKFSYPLINGGTWSLESTTDGVHLNLLLTGNYSLATAAERGPQGPTSATSK